MIEHRTVPHPPQSWAPGAQHRFAAPPAGPRWPGPGLGPVIPQPRPAPVPPSPPPAGLPYAGPPVQEVRIRPLLLWVGLSWLLFGVLVLTGVATVITRSADADAGPDQFFGSGEMATLELDPAANPLVFAALDGGGYVGCEAVGSGADSVLFTPTDSDWSVTVDGREWHAAFHLAPAVAGTYQIRCEGAGASFGVGDESAAAMPGGEALALVALPLVGLATAVTTTIVVLARRRAAQDRLFTPAPGGSAWPGRQW
jgi:hypothetical protein